MLEPNIEEITKIVEKKFSGNKSLFAKAIGVERSQISRILKDGTGAGAQFFGGLMSWCEREGENFRNLIFLPNNVNKINKEA